MFNLHNLHPLPCTHTACIHVKKVLSQRNMQKRIEQDKSHAYCYTRLKVPLGIVAISLSALALLLNGDVRLAVLNALISYIICKFLDYMQHMHRKEAGDHR